MEKLKSLLTVPYKQENYKQFTADFLNDMEADRKSTRLNSSHP